MLDRDIRPPLIAGIRDAHPDAALFEELPLCRAGFADVAAVNIAMWGYEIKSDRDTLNRLPTQITYYDRIFDYSVVVTAPRHLKYVRRIVPKHWGIDVVRQSHGTTLIVPTRRPKKNANVCVESLIRLLWRAEGIRILRTSGTMVAHTTLVQTVWQSLARLPRRALQTAIRDALKVRGGAESGPRRTSCGGSCPIAANAAGCRAHRFAAPLH